MSKSFVLVLTCMIVVGCRHDAITPRQRVDDAEIRTKIIGTWTSKTFLGMSGPFTFSFDAEGNARLVRDGIWTNQTMWRAQDGIVYIAPRNELPQNSDLYWPILHIDDHTLNFATGFSTAPSEKFTK